MEIAVRYSVGRAAQAMAEMRRVLATCHSYPYRPRNGGPPLTRSYAWERERFTGDDALLVLVSDRPAIGRVMTQYITVVRLGDVLITTSSDIGEAIGSRSVALRLPALGARRAACLRSTC